MAAESSDEHAPDRPAATLVREDRQDPPVRERAPRLHVEDDFFARGDESFPPSSVDAHHVEAEEVVHRPISPLVLERRARMRRIVGVVVGTAAALTSLAVARTWLTRKSPSLASDSAFSLENRVLPSIAIAPPQEPSPAAAAQAAPTATPPEEPAPVAQPASHRLPIVDLETPAAPDDATDRAWEKAAKSLSAQDFNGADRVFAELGRNSDVATRETARLARAVWWITNGKQAEVRPVLADLAAHATTPYVQTRARELSRAN